MSVATSLGASVEASNEIKGAGESANARASALELDGLRIGTPRTGPARTRTARAGLRLSRVFAAALFACLLTGTAWADNASLTLVHAMAGDDAFPADVYLNGERIIDALGFDSATRPIALAAGDARLELFAAGADRGRSAPLFARTVLLEEGKSYSLVALVLDGAPLLSFYVDEVPKLPAGQGRLTVRHAASSGALNVAVDGNVLTAGLRAPEESSWSLAEGEHSLALLGTEDAQPLKELPLKIRAGEHTVVYATGSAVKGNLAFLTQTTLASAVVPKGVPTGTGGAKAISVHAGFEPQRVPTFGRASFGRRASEQRLADAVPTRRARPAENRADRRPASIAIPAIGVDAPIVPTGVDPHSGEMYVPKDLVQVAWYRHGPTPGEQGSAVLAAHVDLLDSGRGVFFDLDRLAEEDEVVIRFDDGTTRRFAVAQSERIPKHELDTEQLFDRAGDVRVRLVTCGGAFDRQGLRYSDNLIATLVPLPQH